MSTAEDEAADASPAASVTTVGQLGDSEQQSPVAMGGDGPAAPAAATPSARNEAPVSGPPVFPTTRALGQTARNTKAAVRGKDAAAGKLLSLKVSLRRDRRPAPKLAPLTGSVQVPEWARRRSIGSVAKPFVLVGALALLLGGGYWTLTRERTGESMPSTLQSAAATPERAPPDTGRAGQQLPAASEKGGQRAAPAEPPPTQVAVPAAGLPAVSPPALVAEASPAPAPAAASSPSPAPAPEAVGADGKAFAQVATVYSAKAVSYEWHRLQTLLPDLLGSREPIVTKTHQGGGTRWLVRTGGFDNSTQAAEFCRLVHAKGFHCQVVATD